MAWLGRVTVSLRKSTKHGLSLLKREDSKGMLNYHPMVTADQIKSWASVWAIGFLSQSRAKAYSYYQRRRENGFTGILERSKRGGEGNEGATRC